MNICEYVYTLGNMYTYEHRRAYTHVHMPTWYLGLNVWPNNLFCVLARLFPRCWVMELSSGDGGEGVTECWLLDTQASALATELQPSGLSWLGPAWFPPRGPLLQCDLNRPPSRPSS